MPGGDLHHEQAVEASEGNRVHMEEVAGQQPLRLSARERSPGGVHRSGSRSAPPGVQDPLHGRCADAMTEPAEFAVDSAVSPGGVLPRQSQH
jgi:hypothetical protein